MSNSACNFYIPSSFNANFDITWSFQYALTGNLSATGGFTTFLFNNDSLVGGGALSALGFGPNLGLSGVNDAVFCVAFDTTGLFATSAGPLANGYFNTGLPLSSRIPNSLIIRRGINYTYLTSVSLSDYDIPLLQESVDFNTIRFNLTDVAQTLKIAIKDKATNTYKTILSIPTGLTTVDNTYYNIGFSYASPVSGTSKTTFLIKNVHYQGKMTEGTRDVGEREQVGETKYILASPLSGKIKITKTGNNYLLWQ